jgi:hypothetical protein
MFNFEFLAPWEGGPIVEECHSLPEALLPYLLAECLQGTRCLQRPFAVGDGFAAYYEELSGRQITGH